MSTAIEWTKQPGTTGETWNALVGCRRASPGCEHCYAESMAGRIVRMGGPAAAAYAPVIRTNKRGLSVWNGRVDSLPDRLDLPLGWRKPRTIFVNSMSDLFHEDVTDEFIAAVFGVMAATPWHTYIVLTKRAERLPKWFEWIGGMVGTNTATGERRRAACDPIAGCEIKASRFGVRFPPRQVGTGHYSPSWPLPNVQLGVSCENQEWFDKRVPHLLDTPAAVRLVSLEPLLGPINARPALGTECVHEDAHVEPDTNAVICRECDDATHLDWVITGGESGMRRRECEVEWIESIAEQCKHAGVPCFVKQDSAFKPGQQGRLSDAVFSVKQFPEARRG